MAYYNVINGVGASRVKIYKPNGAYLLNEILPLCQIRGLLESWTPISLTHDIISANTTVFTLNRKKVTRGYFGNWILNWQENPIKSSDTQNFVEILNYANRENHTCYLQPRGDTPGREFKVNLMNEDFNIIQLPGGLDAPGNLGMQLMFQTTDMQDVATSLIEISTASIPAAGETQQPISGEIVL